MKLGNFADILNLFGATFGEPTNHPIPPTIGHRVEAIIVASSPTIPLPQLTVNQSGQTLNRTGNISPERTNVNPNIDIPLAIFGIIDPENPTFGKKPLDLHGSGFSNYYSISRRSPSRDLSGREKRRNDRTKA